MIVVATTTTTTKSMKMNNIISSSSSEYSSRLCDSLFGERRALKFATAASVRVVFSLSLFRPKFVLLLLV